MNVKPILLLSAFAAAGSANALSLAVFNFNDAGVSGTNSPANTSALFAVDRKAASVASAALSSNFAAANIVNFGGSTVNADSGDVAGQALALQGGGSSSPFPNNGAHLDLTVTAAAGQKLLLSSLSFAIQRTATGFTTDTFSYSVNGGVSFTSLAAVASLPSAFAVKSVNLSGIGLVNSIIIRDVLTGATSASGNNRFDNVVLSGTAQAVPEPATMAALGLGAVAMLRRRRKA